MALFIDWLIAVVIPIVIATAATVATRGNRREPSMLDLLWLFLLVFFVLGYFTYFWARGQSLGMMAAGIQIVNPKTGRPPGVVRAAVRAFLFLVFLACAFLLLAIGFSDPPTGGFSTTDLVINYLILSLFLASMVGFFWMIWDRKKQTWQDKLAGVVVIRKTATGATGG